MPNIRSNNDNSSNGSAWSLEYMERVIDTFASEIGIEDFIEGAIERGTNEGNKESNKKLSELNRFKKIKENLRKIHKKEV